MNKQPITRKPKAYSTPELRCYGSVVSTTLGSVGKQGDMGAKKA